MNKKAEPLSTVHGARPGFLYLLFRAGATSATVKELSRRQTSQRTRRTQKAEGREGSLSRSLRRPESQRFRE